jgi:hypothetical protein
MTAGCSGRGLAGSGYTTRYVRYFGGVFGGKRWFALWGAMLGFLLDTMDVLLHVFAVRALRVEFVWTNARADATGAAGASGRFGPSLALISGFCFLESALIFLLPDARNTKLEVAGAESD